MPATRLQHIEKRKKFIRYAIVLLGIILLILGMAIIVRILGFYNAIHTEAQETSNSKKQEIKDKNEYTFLLLGYGGEAHEGTYLTDTIVVINLNIKENRIIMISLPRDIWVKVPTKDGEFHSKINAVYQMGLFPKKYPNINKSFITEDNPSGLIKEVVKSITGLEVDAFAAVDFKGFIKTIDTLGGIDIVVKKTFTDYEYPIEGEENNLCERDEDFQMIESIINKKATDDEIKKIYEDKPELEQFVKDIKDHPSIAFPCRFEEIHFEAGLSHMDGITSLKYSRSRHAIEDGGDFNRARRQQSVLEAIKKKVLDIGFIPKIIPLFDELENHIITDIPLSDINKLLREAPNSNQYVVDTFVLTGEYLQEGYSEYGGYIIYPKEGFDKWDFIIKTIQNMKKGITPSPKNINL